VELAEVAAAVWRLVGLLIDGLAERIVEFVAKPVEAAVPTTKVLVAFLIAEVTDAYEADALDAAEEARDATEEAEAATEEAEDRTEDAEDATEEAEDATEDATELAYTALEEATSAPLIPNWFEYW